MSEDSVSLKNYLQDIAERSKQGLIDWVQPNPSTFAWVTSDFSVTLQKAVGPRTLRSAGLLSIEGGDEASYLFQVAERQTNSPVVSLSSKDRPEFGPLLAVMYRGAERGMDVKASRVLKRLLNS